MNSSWWFRVEETIYAPAMDEYGRPSGSSTVDVRIYQYTVIKETPKGVWLALNEDRKFVLRGATKRWACPTIEEAIVSFRARKEKHIRILEEKLRLIRRALIIVERRTDDPGNYPLWQIK